MIRRVLPPLALIVAALGLAAALATGSARDLLVLPLVRLIWLVGQVVESLPQLAVWWALVVVAVVQALRSLSDTPRLLLPGRGGREHGGRVEDWARVVDLAPRDPYARWRLAQRLALLATEVLAQRRGVDLRAARRELESSAELPPEVRAYLRAGLGAHRPARGLRSLLRAPLPSDPLALDPARALDAIERL